MTLHKALYPRDDVDRLYVSRKAGGRGLLSIQVSVDPSTQRFEHYIKKLVGNNRNNTDYTRINRTKKKSENKNEKENYNIDITSEK